jgi:hypothetical protein
VGSVCGDVVKSMPGHCSLRSLLRFQFPAFQRFEVSTPLRRTAEIISAPRGASIIATSIGSPETDRGPPRS